MGKWAGKYVIGLTGNIGTGKSVVRRMLEHMGAYGIDADGIAHRAIAKGAPGYEAVRNAFGDWILTPEGQIDRDKLGRFVFSNPQALRQLEEIVHPLVLQAIDMLIERVDRQIVVIEAIKLFEAGLAESCDSVWVTYSSPENQLKRLVKNRGMTGEEAVQRIDAQPPQELKLGSAQVVIKNETSFEETWRQVKAAWKQIEFENALPPVREEADLPVGEISIVRAKPSHASQIARLYQHLRKDRPPLKPDDVLVEFGEKAYLLLQVGQQIVGVLGWQVENLVARTIDILIDPAMPAVQVIPPLIEEMERASRELLCETSLVFAPAELAELESLWRELGYELRTPMTLGVLAWQEAALESMAPGSALYFKQLRPNRILKPV